MTADEARALFSAALEGELTPEEQRRLAAALQRDAALGAEYREFIACNAALRQAAAATPGPVPDLLPGVQSRLRTRSRGRFYADRFAERSGTGWQPTVLFAVLMLALLALCWLGFTWFGGELLYGRAARAALPQPAEPSGSPSHAVVPR